MEYTQIQNVSELVSISDLNLDLSLAIALSLTRLHHNVDTLLSIYQECIHLIGPIAKDPLYSTKVEKNIMELVEALDPDFTDKNSIKTLGEDLMVLLFMKHLNTDCTDHAMDQIFLFSSEALNDPSMPTILQWITWFGAVMILESRPGVLESSINSLLALKVESFAGSLERLFVGTKREQLIYETRIPSPYSKNIEEEVIEIKEEDIQDNLVPTFYNQLQLWKKNRKMQRKQRAIRNLKRWRAISHYCIYWIRFVKECRTLARKPRIKIPTPEVKDPRTVIEEKSKKTPARETMVERKDKGMKKSLTIQVANNGTAQLTPLGELMEALIESSNLVFVTETNESLNLGQFVAEQRRAKSSTPKSTAKQELFEKVLDSIDCSNLN
jgi:hypothetical protein